jgi:outer membrane PBP1 activator LpoA protein
MLRTAPLLLALALTAGCASVSVQSEPSAPQRSAEQLAEAGQHAEAAQAWTQVAEAGRGSARDRAWLQAAEQARLAGEPEQMRAAWSQSNRRRLEGSDVVLHDTLTASVRMAAGQPGQALALLAQPRESVPTAQRAHWHEVRAQAYEAGGRRFDAAGELAWMNDLLDRDARVENIRRIDALLRAVPDAQLAASSATLPAGHPLYVYAGRALTSRGLPLPRPYDRSASSAGFEDLPQAEFDGYRPPLRLAALLPLSGPAAVAGKSVRDGLLAGYYGENRRRPQLRFYDTAEAGGVVAA